MPARARTPVDAIGHLDEGGRIGLSTPEFQRPLLEVNVLPFQAGSDR
jgi:hypothetical protein